MERRKMVPGLLILLILMACTLVAMPVMAQVTFTGNVETDFPSTDPSVSICTDPGGSDTLLNFIVVPPLPPNPNASSGWDIKDVRLTYNSVADVLYVGLNSYATVGDADSDGFEGLKTYGAGLDIPNLGVGESVAVYFDLNQDGNWDVIAGVPSNTDYSGFTIRNASGSTPGMAFFDTMDLSTHLGTRYWTPGTAPDLEFQILDFDGLPNQGGALGEFTIGAFMGSIPDQDIIEDVMIGSVNLTTPPPPVGGTAFPVNKLGLLAPWAILLGLAGIVVLLALRRRQQA